MQTFMQCTRSALLCAQQHGLEATLRALVLPVDAHVDDHVELPSATGPVTFIVRRRCWQADPNGRLQLLIELDHPPRPSGLR